MKVAAIIPAAGDGKRLKSKKGKPFMKVLGKPLFIWTLLSLTRSYNFYEMILLMKESNIGRARLLLDRYGLNKVRVVPGGKTRAESVRNGLWDVSNQCDFTLVHDMARPLVSKKLVQALLKVAKKKGAVICALPATDTVKWTEKKKFTIEATLDRKQVYLAQTPQVFRTKLLKGRYQKLGDEALKRTDEASLFDGSTSAVMLFPGDPRNIKITTPSDVKLLKFYLKK